ncbi:hypothetical protein ACEU2D_09050 [Brevibacillus laterosporus]|uniref:hypothetical protein n=1 Tax=Brevibacillus laterosporus TaxID=1465 RepID=UPI0035A70D69
MVRYEFKHEERLGILIPFLYLEWEEYDPAERADILLQWEEIRSRIPDRVIALEAVINQKQAVLYQEEDFERSCELNSEIAELASTINDLNIWFRIQQDFEPTEIHG